MNPRLKCEVREVGGVRGRSARECARGRLGFGPVKVGPGGAHDLGPLHATSSRAGEVPLTPNPSIGWAPLFPSFFSFAGSSGTIFGPPFVLDYFFLRGGSCAKQQAHVQESRSRGLGLRLNGPLHRRALLPLRHGRRSVRFLPA